jgi:hypothetical protein
LFALETLKGMTIQYTNVNQLAAKVYKVANAMMNERMKYNEVAKTEETK